MATFKSLLILTIFIFVGIVAFGIDTLDVDLTIQGYLKDSGGTPVSDGLYDFTFSIYDDPAAGNLLWSEPQVITVSDGLWLTNLGAVNPVPDSTLGFMPESYGRWLGIRVGSDDEMMPRTKLGGTPYAGFARGLNGHIKTRPGGMQLFPETIETHSLIDFNTGDSSRMELITENTMSFDTTLIEMQTDDILGMVNVAFREYTTGDVLMVSSQVDETQAILDITYRATSDSSLMRFAAGRDTTIASLSAIGDNAVNILDITNIDPITFDTIFAERQIWGADGKIANRNLADITRQQEIIDDTMTYEGMQFVDPVSFDTTLIEMQTGDNLGHVNVAFREPTIGDISRVTTEVTETAAILDVTYRATSDSSLMRLTADNDGPIISFVHDQAGFFDSSLIRSDGFSFHRLIPPLGSGITSSVTETASILDITYRATSDSSLMRFAADNNGPEISMQDISDLTRDSSVMRSGNISFHHSEDGGISYDSAQISLLDVTFFTNVGDAVYRYGSSGIEFSNDSRATSFSVDPDGNVLLSGIQMPTGAGDGYVLTSDEFGNGTWQEPTGGSGGGGWTDDGSVVRLETSSDQVGIGTSSPDPDYAVEIDGATAGLAGMKITSQDGDGFIPSDASLNVTNGNAVGGIGIYGSSGVNGKAGYFFNNSSRETLTGHNNGSGPAIHAQAQGGGTAYKANGNGRLMHLFSTVHTADQFIVENDGDVFINGDLGIGTTSPSEKLDIYDDKSHGIGIDIENANSDANSSVDIKFIDDNGDYCLISQRDADYPGQENSWMFFNNRGIDSRNVFVLNGWQRFKMTVDTFYVAANLVCWTDNNRDLGAPAHRWKNVWASNGTIQTSDRRIKRDITHLNYGLHEVMKLRPVSYRWKDSNDNKLRLGLIAQEVQELVPEAVIIGDDPEKLMGMNYEQLLPVMINAIQEQQATIVNLERQILQLNSLVETILAAKNNDKNAGKKLTAVQREGGGK